MRQTFFKSVYKDFSNHSYIGQIHYFSQYVENYSTLEKEKIFKLLEVLNA